MNPKVLTTLFCLSSVILAYAQDVQNVRVETNGLLLDGRSYVYKSPLPNGVNLMSVVLEARDYSPMVNDNVDTTAINANTFPILLV